MEVHPGVFVSNAATEEDWLPDPDVGSDAEQHVLFDMSEEGGAWAGLSRFGADGEPIRWTAPSREVLIVIEGEVRIEIAGGPTLELKPGDLASLPEGVETTWYVVKSPFRELAVLL